jgi:hypothetical protein
MTIEEIFRIENIKILLKGYGCYSCGKPDKHLGFLGYCPKHSTSGIAYSLPVVPLKKKK